LRACTLWHAHRLRCSGFHRWLSQEKVFLFQLVCKGGLFPLERGGTAPPGVNSACRRCQVCELTCEHAIVLLCCDPREDDDRYRRDGFDEEIDMRRVYSQVIKWKQLCDTAEDYEHRDGEVHHAAANTLASIPTPQWLFKELTPSSSKLQPAELTKCRRSPWRIDWRGVGTAV
jgi:hypothetical protein